MDRILTRIIKGYLTKYIHNVPDLRLSIWSGDVVLDNLEIRLDGEILLVNADGYPTALERQHSLPVIVTRGFIGQLRIHIPWTSLAWEPLRVSIHTIEVVLTPNTTPGNPTTRYKKDSHNTKSQGKL